MSAPARQAIAPAARLGSVARPRVEHGDPSGRALAAVLTLLPIAALTEALLVRTFYRVGVYIPKEGPFRAVYGSLTAIGSFALNLASVLAVVALVLIAARAIRAGRGRPAIAIGAFLFAWLIVRLAGAQTLGPTARLAFALAVVAIALPFVRGVAPLLQRALAGGVALVLLLSVYAGLAGDGSRFGVRTLGGVQVGFVAEALAVVTAFLALGAWIAERGPRLRPLALASIPALGLLGLWSANGATTGILTLWTVGLRLYLPLGLYALALWAVLAAALGWLPHRPFRSAGLLLLPVAGILLGSTYLQALGLIALVGLTDGVALGGLPEPVRRPRRGRRSAV